MDIGKRILVVDNEPHTAASTLDYLENAGYFPQFVDSGKEAWAVLSENPNRYDVIIANRAMPGLDGIKLLMKIKQSPALNNIPVIIETGKDDNKSYFAALEAGAYDLVYKPLEKKFLLYVVNNAVNEAELDRSGTFA